MAWGGQFKDKKNPTIRTDKNGHLLWGGQTRAVKRGRRDEDDRHKGEIWSGTRKIR